MLKPDICVYSVEGGERENRRGRERKREKRKANRRGREKERQDALIAKIRLNC
jgi:hypothetical protein